MRVANASTQGVAACEVRRIAPNLMLVLVACGDATMFLRDRRWCLALMLCASPLAAAGDDALRTVTTAAPLTIPHSLQLELDFRARRTRGGEFETPNFLDPHPGLRPLAFARSSDVRARLLTPELKRTPLVGWIATNLYRSKRENGWCLEVDPGEGEYVVFYRRHL